jgi:hypothetical protein
MRRIVHDVLTGAVVLLLAPRAGAEVEQRTWVVASGGGYVAGTSRDHWCTAGQPAVGISGGTLYVQSSGFWYPTQHCYPFSSVPDPTAALPTEYSLAHGSPNPLGAVGSIVYAVPVAGHVRIGLYDVTGREVQRLVDEPVESGQHEANLRTPDLAAGIYFCRMEARGFAATRKLVLLR